MITHRESFESADDRQFADYFLDNNGSPVNRDKNEQLNIHGVMQAEASDSAVVAAVGQRSVDTVAARWNCPYSNHYLHLNLFGYCNACQTRIERKSSDGQP